MSLRYKMDILEALKEAGYSAYRLRKEKIFGERVVQQLRQGELVSWATIEKVCTLLDCQPGDLLEHVPTDRPAGSPATCKSFPMPPTIPFHPAAVATYTIHQEDARFSVWWNYILFLSKQPAH